MEAAAAVFLVAAAMLAVLSHGQHQHQPQVEAEAEVESAVNPFLRLVVRKRIPTGAPAASNDYDASDFALVTDDDGATNYFFYDDPREKGEEEGTFVPPTAGGVPNIITTNPSLVTLEGEEEQDKETTTTPDGDNALSVKELLEVEQPGSVLMQEDVSSTESVIAPDEVEEFGEYDDSAPSETSTIPATSPTISVSPTMGFFSTEFTDPAAFTEDGADATTTATDGGIFGLDDNFNEEDDSVAAESSAFSVFPPPHRLVVSAPGGFAATASPSAAGYAPPHRLVANRPPEFAGGCCACSSHELRIPATQENIDLLTSTTSSDGDTTTDLPRGMRNLGLDDIAGDILGIDGEDEDKEEKGADEEKPLKPNILAQSIFREYFARLRKIYEIDMRLLDQVSAIIAGVDPDLVPSIEEGLEPLLLASSSAEAASAPSTDDILTIVGHVVKTLQRSHYEASISTHLGALDFLDIGPTTLSSFMQQAGYFGDISGDIANDEGIRRYLSRVVLAQIDSSGLRFPIRALLLGPRAFRELTNRQLRRENDHIAMAVIANQLRSVTSGESDGRMTVALKDGEIIMDNLLPSMTIADDCKATIQTSPMRIIARVRRSTTLRTVASFRGADDDPEASTFVGGEVDFDVTAHGETWARLGKDLFGRCFTKYRNRFPAAVYSGGRVWIGARLITSDLRIEERPYNPDALHRFPFFSGGAYGPQTPHSHHQQHGYYGAPTFSMEKHLVFRFRIRFDARIVRFNLDHLKLSGCDVRFLGVKVISFCGKIRKLIRDAVGRFTLELNEVHMPYLLRRIEHLLHAKIGDEIAIPLLLADEKAEVFATVFEKIDNVARLKGDLAQDLSKVSQALPDGFLLQTLGSDLLELDIPGEDE